MLHHLLGLVVVVGADQPMLISVIVIFGESVGRLKALVQANKIGFHTFDAVGKGDSLRIDVKLVNAGALVDLKDIERICRKMKSRIQKDIRRISLKRELFPKELSLSFKKNSLFKTDLS